MDDGAICISMHTGGNSLLFQPLDKRMEEKVFGSINIHLSCIGSGHIARNRYYIAIGKPIAGDFQFPCLRVTAHCPITNPVIIWNRSTTHCRQRIFLSRWNGHIHTTAIQHQRRKIRLEWIRSIIPRPPRSPIYGIRHRYIGSNGIRHIPDTLRFHRRHEAIQVFIHQLRVKAPYQIKIPFQCIILYFPGIAKMGIHCIICPKTGKRCDRSNHLLNGSRAIQFLILIPIKRFTRGQVEDRDTNFGSFQDFVVQQSIQPLGNRLALGINSTNSQVQ